MKFTTKKIVALLISLVIITILSAIISNCLFYVFTNQSLEITNLDAIKVISNIIQVEDVRLMFIIVYIAFCVIIVSSTFKLFSKENYLAKTYQVTDNIKIPLPVGKNQTQHGSAWWLPKSKFKNAFGVNTVDPENPTIKELLKFGNQLKKEVSKNEEPNIKDIINKDYGKLEQVFKKGGLVVGKKDRRILSFAQKKIGKFKIPYIVSRKVEDIYYIADNLHSLIVGQTRSGKTRCEVVPTIENCGMAGESMIISDPKGELYEYSAVGLEKLGYKVLTLDFKNPLKSSHYNFLQPVIDAVLKNDIPLAENKAADIVQSLVGDAKGERIWNDGEKSTMKARNYGCSC